MTEFGESERHQAGNGQHALAELNADTVYSEQAVNGNVLLSKECKQQHMCLIWHLRNWLNPVFKVSVVLSGNDWKGSQEKYQNCVSLKWVVWVNRQLNLAQAYTLNSYRRVIITRVSHQSFNCCLIKLLIFKSQIIDTFSWLDLSGLDVVV